MKNKQTKKEQTIRTKLIALNFESKGATRVLKSETLHKWKHLTESQFSNEPAGIEEFQRTLTNCDGDLKFVMNLQES